MTPFPPAAPRPTALSARSVLTALMASVGTTGLPAAARQPALLALLDQHAAAVRDSLWGDLQPLSPLALARYAEGVRDAAAEHGWTAPTAPIDWSDADWVLTRLLAVCALARAAGAPTS